MRGVRLDWNTTYSLWNKETEMKADIQFTDGMTPKLVFIPETSLEYFAISEFFDNYLIPDLHRELQPFKATYGVQVANDGPDRDIGDMLEDV